MEFIQINEVVMLFITIIMITITVTATVTITIMIMIMIVIIIKINSSSGICIFFHVIRINIKIMDYLVQALLTIFGNQPDH